MGVGRSQRSKLETYGYDSSGNTGGPAYAVPTLTTVTPNTAVAGSGSIGVTLNGTDFHEDSMASVDGVEFYETNFSSSTDMDVLGVSVGDTPVVRQVRVHNGPYESNALPFTVT